ncbi:MAG: DUF4493 domain-containing protein [Bacteroidales bacterium]|nr:DUF4493 domain-containing protein [Bacteroidales bacterium]
MNSIYKLLLALLPLIALSACSKEDPFPSYDGPMGMLSTKSISLELENEENIIQTKQPLKLPKYVPNVQKRDFTIAITKDGDSRPYASYKYSELPEVISLPVGKYKAVASYGSNPVAAFDAPYFSGEKNFEIVQDQITDDIGPIVARFSNIRVTIIFDPVLMEHCDADAKVSVKAGSGILNFTPEEDRSGYFRYLANSATLAAEFSGSIDGNPDSNVISFQNVQPGNHYRITFRLATIAGSETGDHDVAIKIDTDCEEMDMNVSAETDWEPIDDDRFETGETPEPPVTASGPSIVPAPGTGLNLDAENKVGADSKVALNVTSASGFTEFKVYIDDEELAELLEASMGVRYFDLINPGESLEACHSLGLLDNGQTSLSGLKSKDFDVSGFMPMLVGVGSDRLFIFRLVISDADGSITQQLKLRTL